MTNIADGELTSLALCWRLERSDGAGLALTSHDQAVPCDGIECQASPGMNPASIARSLGLEQHSGEVGGALSSDHLEDKDLALGRWDEARVRLSAADWQDSGAATIPLLAGELGSVSVTDESFTAELLGAVSKLDATVCPSTSATCRAQFGDKQCRVDLAGRSIRATVVSSNGASLHLEEDIDDRFRLGRLRYLSGENCGLATVILSIDGSTIRVRDVPRLPVGAGCRVQLREGCDKSFQTCVERFNNAVNFRGEPQLPGTDHITRYPGI